MKPTNVLAQHGATMAGHEVVEVAGRRREAYAVSLDGVDHD